MTASENRKTPPKERRTDGRRLHLMNVDEERGSAGEQPPSAVGRSLRRARRDKGLSLEQAAQALRIKREHLEALETSRHEDLPGATYAIGFLRSYAAFLELDARAVVAQFKEEERVRADPTRLVFPEPV
ncbi:MAG TPA: helix-turn-helix domain-containing protein, partial [Alphaproteobacteria bacterium]|nr:helix-turn-helix domain-containing protein [Alphaproteobacteria bacterium]